MPIGNPQTLKERVDVLEQQLLAINCLSNICQAASDGNGVDLPQSDVAFLMVHLSESSLYKVEALRMQIHALPDSVETAAKVERRRKPRAPKLAAVA